MESALSRRVLRSILFDFVLAWIRAAAFIVVLIVICAWIGEIFGFGMFLGIVFGWLSLWALFLYVLVLRRESAKSKARREEADRRLGITGDHGH
jgi:hypothetical protein